MTTLLFLLCFITALAALGRLVIPHAERLPWWTWTWADLIANLTRGARVLADANQGQRRLWELHHHQLQHPHRYPDHPDGFPRHRERHQGNPPH